jgi:hypothetical protein
VVPSCRIVVSVISVGIDVSAELGLLGNAVEPSFRLVAW